MILKTPTDSRYYIKPRSVSFVENDLDDPNRVYVSIASGTTILAYVDGLIPYNEDKDYQKWTLKGYSTKVASLAEYKVYARLSRTDSVAEIRFSTKNYNVDGSTEDTEASETHFYLPIGTLTATDGTTSRELTYDSGKLSMPDNSYTKEEVDELVKERSDEYLSKKEDDTAEGHITFAKGFTSEGDSSVAGTFTASSVVAEKSVSVAGTVISGVKTSEGEGNPSDTAVPTTAAVAKEYLSKLKEDVAKELITFIKGIQFGETFIPGLLGTGGKIDGGGHGEMRSLKLWESLDVPEINYNRVTIYTGIRWDTFGGGIIETVTPDETGVETGTCTLKLEDGEVGAVAEGDLCMGIWHDLSGNSTERADDRKGNFTFAGFKTVYFQITGVSGENNNTFTYVLRGEAEGGNGVHPFAMMNFAGRGNISNKERQSFTYTTTEYMLMLADVNTWEFTPYNYKEIKGKLDGFTLPAVNSAGETYMKTFHGYGQVFGNAYIYGQLEQFERVGYRCTIEQSLGGFLAPGETEDVSVIIFNGYGEVVTEQFTLYSVTRTTGDEASDALWNAQHTNVGNPFQISFSDLGIDGIHTLVATFYVTATDESSDASATAVMEFST